MSPLVVCVAVNFFCVPVVLSPSVIVSRTVSMVGIVSVRVMYVSCPYLVVKGVSFLLLKVSFPVACLCGAGGPLFMFVVIA